MGGIDGVELGRFGVWTFDFEHQPAAQMRESVQELEQLGWRAVWVPELFGREALTQAGYLLSCTKQVHVINGQPTGVFDSAAVAAVRRASFAPVKGADGLPTAVKTTLKIRFTLAKGGGR